MATAALIKIGGVVGSNDDLPINTLVQLDNQGAGGETTWLWQILDQPAGTADNLSATNIVNPTFTPKKEGTYLLKLTVNKTLSNEKSNQVVAGIRQLKTRARIPAAGETIEDGAAKGYAIGTTPLLQLLDQMRADPDVLIGQLLDIGVVRGDVLALTGSTTIKSGLPGQEKVPSFSLAPGNNATKMAGPLYVLELGVNGSASPAQNTLVVARRSGLFRGFTAAGAASDAVYVADSGVLQAATPGTVPRTVGKVVTASGGVIDIAFDGTAGGGIPLVSQCFRWTIAPGGEQDFIVTLPTAEPNANYAPAYSLESVVAANVVTFPNGGGDRTTTTFRCVATAPFTDGDTILFTINRLP